MKISDRAKDILWALFGMLMMIIVGGGLPLLAVWWAKIKGTV